LKKVVFFLLISLAFSITPNILQEAEMPIVETSNVSVSLSVQVSTCDNQITVFLEHIPNFPEQEAVVKEVPDKKNVMSHFDDSAEGNFSGLRKVKTKIKTDIAIMIDCDSGEVLYEKNADRYWTAASLSKVFLLYLVMQKVDRGEIDLDEYVDIEKEEWLGNMPVDATTMHLEQGQRVTYRQLIQGLAIVSANDAAYLFVNKLFGGKDNYARTINDLLSKYGFNQLHVEEPSGMSGFNRITARQFADFCNLYINQNSKLLKEVHSMTSFTYPLKDNLVEGRKYRYKTTTRNNTNILVGKYDGADGLKTGFLSMSGFNIVATAKRNGKRLLVVLLGSKTKGGVNGKVTLVEDAKKLFDKGFDIFK